MLLLDKALQKLEHSIERVCSDKGLQELKSEIYKLSAKKETISGQITELAQELEKVKLYTSDHNQKASYRELGRVRLV